MGITDYGVSVATNSAAREDPEFARLLMDEGERLHEDKYALFSKKIGNCAIVESADGKIAVIKRADDMHEYHGCYDTPGGHADPKVDEDGNIEDACFTPEYHFSEMKREVSEEIGIPSESIEESYLIGMAANLEMFGNPDMLFYLRTGLDSSRMDPNEEVAGLEKLTREELFERFKGGELELVPPSEALVTAYFHQKGWM